MIILPRTYATVPKKRLFRTKNVAFSLPQRPREVATACSLVCNGALVADPRRPRCNLAGPPLHDRRLANVIFGLFGVKILTFLFVMIFLATMFTASFAGDGRSRVVVGKDNFLWYHSKKCRMKFFRSVLTFCFYGG